MKKLLSILAIVLVTFQIAVSQYQVIDAKDVIIRRYLIWHDDTIWFDSFLDTAFRYHWRLYELDNDDHEHYALLAGRTGDILNIDTIRALDSDGLSLFDDGNSGIFIEDGGNVGIGTTDPDASLEIQHQSGHTSIFKRVNEISANSNALILMRRTRGTLGAETTVLDGDRIGQIRFEGYHGSGYGYPAGIIASVDSALSGTTVMGNLTFWTQDYSSFNEKMRIDRNGNVGIGTTDIQAKLDVNGNIHGDTLRIDSIWEMTTDHGVKIEGVKFYDSIVNSLRAIQFTTGYTDLPHEEAKIWWDDDNKTLTLDKEGGTGVRLQVGQEMHLRAYNNSGATITNGQVCKLTGAQGHRPTIALAQADTITNAYVLGVATHDIANGSNGYLTTIGLVRDLNTTGIPEGETWSEGNLLYLSPTTPGSMTNISPNADSVRFLIGAVLYSHATEGIISIRLIVWQRLSFLSDVNARGNQVDGNILQWDGTNEYWDTTSISVDGSEVDLLYLNTPTYKTLQDYVNTLQTAGWISGGTFTDNSDGTITVAAGTGMIKSTDAVGGNTYFFDWSQDASVSLVDNSTNYIYIDYNAGTPIVGSETTKNIYNRTKFYLGKVFREGTEAHLLNAGVAISETAIKTIGRLTEQFGEITRVSGAIVAETGNRYLTVTAASLWAGLIKVTTSSINTSGADTFKEYYRDGLGGWTENDKSQIDSLYYDDNTGTLHLLTPNKYGVHWVYLCNDGHLAVIFGQDDYTLSNAELSQPPSTLPDRIAEFSDLIARIITQKNDANLTEIESAFDEQFTSSTPTDHNELSGLQGGTSDEYYHMTSAEYTDNAYLSDTVSILATQNDISDFITGIVWGDITGTVSNQLDLQSDLDGKYDEISATTNYLYKVGTNGTTVLGSIIFDDGTNVGIGTATPATKLEVVGVITATGGNSTEWNTAYGWGDHSLIGYLEWSDTVTDLATQYYVGSQGFIMGNETITLSSDVTGSGTTSIVCTVVDDSHNHVIGNVDNLQDSLNQHRTDWNSDIHDSLVANSLGFLTGVAWGDITGTLSNQTDLQNELNGKYDKIIMTNNYLLKAATSGSTLVTSIIIDDGTNVGIGSATPGNKLDVTGTIEMTGFKLTTSPTNGHVLKCDAAGVGTWQAATGGGNVSNTGTPLATQISVWTDATTIKGVDGFEFVTAASDAYIAMNVTDQANRIYIWDRTYLTSNKLNLGVISTGSDLIEAEGGGISVFKLDTIGTTYFLGNVGIASTSPAQKLDVVGTIQTTGLIITSLANSSELTALVIDGTTVKANALGNDFAAISDSSKWTLSGTDIYSANSGNVGIGSTVPAYKLDVDGVVGVSTALRHRGDDDTYIEFSTDIMYISAGNALAFQIIESAYDYILYGGTYDHKFNNDLLFIGGSSGGYNGFVGIGTTQPSKKLDVQGTALITGTLTTEKVQAIDSDGLFLYEDGGTGIFIEDGGQVGIGTTTPEAMLHINVTGVATRFERNINSIASATHRFDKSRGTASAKTDVQAGDQLGSFQFWGYKDAAYHYGAILGSYVESVTTDNVAGYFTFSTTNTSFAYAERMRLTADGNLGIGSTDPVSLLDVTGLTTTNTLTIDAIGAATETTDSVLYVFNGGKVGYKYLGSCFSATKTATKFNTTGTYAKLTGWATDIYDTHCFTWDATNNELEIDVDGRYMIVIDVYGRSTTGNARTTLYSTIYENIAGGGFAQNTQYEWYDYVVRFSTATGVQDEGGISGTYIADYDDGDKVAIYVKDDGETLDIEADDARIYVIKVK